MVNEWMIIEIERNIFWRNFFKLCFEEIEFLGVKKDNDNILNVSILNKVWEVGKFVFFGKGVV